MHAALRVMVSSKLLAAWQEAGRVAMRRNRPLYVRYCGSRFKDLLRPSRFIDVLER
jgi:hypothetical protein